MPDHDLPLGSNLDEEPQKMANLAVLRQLCLQRFWQEPARAMSDREKDEVLQIFSAEVRKWNQARADSLDWRENAGLVILARDLDDYGEPVPLWAQLAAWLAPESVAGSAPNLIVKIAEGALAGNLGRRKARQR